MKSIFPLSVFIVIFCFQTVFSEPITLEDATLAAKKSYFSISSKENLNSYEQIQTQLIFTESVNSIPLYYIFNIGVNKGFVIISADDDAFPLIGISLERGFALQKPISPEYEWWMNNVKEQIIEIKSEKLQADQKINNEWTKLRSANYINDNYSSVSPLLTTTWDQGCYYNALCPQDPQSIYSCNRALVGCVATAMAQTMKYYNFPATGSGSNSYNSPGYGTQSANFGSTTYNWSAMPNNVTSSNSAVATLSYHCGVGVNMTYGADGSASYVTDARNALVNYFKYKSSASYKKRMNYSSSWESLLITELNSSRPVIYGGYNTNSGHCWVCDGYTTSGSANLFHMNWGWSGQYNGYFYSTALNPATSNYSSNQDGIFGIEPSSSSNTTVLTQNFTSVGFPPDDWSIFLFGTDVYWMRSASNAFGGSGGCARFDFWNAPVGETQDFMTGNFTPVTNSTNQLKFAHAHRSASYQNHVGVDKLLIFTSSNNGQEWNLAVTYLGGQNGSLATGPLLQTEYIAPASNEWAWKQITLPVGTNRVSFTAVSDFGNSLFIDNISIGSPNSIQPLSLEIPDGFKLSQNYPNPFNPKTNIKFSLPKSSLVVIKVFNILGKEIETIVNEKLQPGTYNVDWNAVNHPSGIYFYTILTENYSETKKMMLIK